MPLFYDDEPGSWGRASVNWPSLVVPVERVAKLRETGAHYPEHGAAVQLCREAGVPYGSYVTVGDVLRVENEEYLAAVKALTT